MAICPKCKYEYRNGVSECPDCNEKLVDRLPAEAAARAPDGSWVSVCRLPSQFRTEMVKGALDSSNIPSIVISTSFNAYGRGMDMSSNLLSSPGETNVLMVPKEFRQEAELILQAILGDDFDELYAENS